MGEDIRRNTAFLLDSINSGNVDNVRRIVQSDLRIDVDANVADLIRYTTVEVPFVMVDCIDKREMVSPRKILGCALLRDDARILRLILEFTNIVRIEDYDAIISLHYSTREIHRIILNRFPVEMAHRNLYAGPENVYVGPNGAIPRSVLWVYTPIHVILLSLSMSQFVSNCFPRRMCFFSTQLAKYNYIVSRGGIFDSRRRRIAHLGTLTHLLLDDYIDLARKCLVSEFLQPFDQTRLNNFIQMSIRKMRRNPILFFLYDQINNHLHLPGNSNFQNKLLEANFLRHKLSGSIQKMTEFIVNNYFVFYGHSYKIRGYDTPARLYNLFRAGVYLIDDLDYAKDLLEIDRITPHVLYFIEESKSPFTLEFLCKLLIKRHIGPKNHFRKIKNLGLQVLMTDYLGYYKYTQNNVLYFPESWCLPHTQIPGEIRYFEDDDDLI